MVSTAAGSIASDCTPKSRALSPSVQCVRAPAIRANVRCSAAVSRRPPCLRAIWSNSPAVKSPHLSGRIVPVLGLVPARSVREIEGDVGRVIFLEVAQGMTKDLSMSKACKALLVKATRPDGRSRPNARSRARSRSEWRIPNPPPSLIKTTAKDSTLPRRVARQTRMRARSSSMIHCFSGIRVYLLC